jgi:hypothetical protein
VPFTQEPTFPEINAQDISYTVTCKEITERLNKLKKNTALGPYGAKKHHLQRTEVRTSLQHLYILLISGRLPSEWNINRTTLIPKSGNNLRLAENYRPIKIGSIVCQLLWGILDKRLRERIVFCPWQNGIVYQSGCFNNMHILNELLHTVYSQI